MSMPVVLQAVLIACLAVPSLVTAPACTADPAASQPGGTLRLNVHADEGVRSISPLSYGANEGGVDAIPFRRHGGNRFTAFDWETSASSAGSDWLHQNDHYLAPEEDLRGPGLLLARRIEADRERGARTLVTLQLAGYVAGDADGPVSEEQLAPSDRWKRVVLEPSSPRAGGPDITDGVVYLDEQVRDLVERFGTAADGGVLGYALDNEPALWSHTHARMHPEPARYAEVVDKGIAAARLITAEDPSAEVFGPVLYGWAAFHDLQGAPDAARHRVRHPTFVDHYLARMKQASE